MFYSTRCGPTDDILVLLSYGNTYIYLAMSRIYSGAGVRLQYRAFRTTALLARLYLRCFIAQMILACDSIMLPCSEPVRSGLSAPSVGQLGSPSREEHVLQADSEGSDRTHKVCGGQPGVPRGSQESGDSEGL